MTIERSAGLSETFIEEQIQKSHKALDVKRSIRCFYENLDRPAAPVVGFGERSSSENDADKKNSELIVPKLCSRGLDAVSVDDERAKDPNVFVVTESGIHSPFLSPEEALKANIILVETIKESGFRPYLSNPLTREALVPAIDNKNQDSSPISIEDLAKYNKNERYEEIMNNFVDEFIENATYERFTATMSHVGNNNDELTKNIKSYIQKNSEAYTKNNIITTENQNKLCKDILTEFKTELKPYIKNEYQTEMAKEVFDKGINPEILNQKNIESLNKDKKLASVFHGGKQGGKPYAVLSHNENMSFIYGASMCAPCHDIKVGEDTISSSGSIGYAFSQSSHNTRKYSSKIDYGFVYQYESRGEKQEMTYIDNAHPYKDGKFDLNSISGSRDETPILPHQNKLEGIYIASERTNPETKFLEKKVFKLELDEKGEVKDKKWKDFLELSNPINDNLKGNMVERRNNVIAEYDAVGELNMNRKLNIKDQPQDENIIEKDSKNNDRKKILEAMGVKNVKKPSAKKTEFNPHHYNPFDKKLSR